MQKKPEEILKTITQTLAGASLISIFIASAGAIAQTYPNKPIRFLVPLPPGSAVDVVGRTLGDVVSKQLGQPLTVENRAGANTNISTDACAKATPDGYTICMVTHSISLNPYLCISERLCGEGRI